MMSLERGVAVVEKLNRLRVASVLPDLDLCWMFRDMMTRLRVERVYMDTGVNYLAFDKSINQ